MAEDEDHQSGWRPLWRIGAIGALIAALLGMLAPHDGAFWRVPPVLHDRVSTALQAAGFPGLDVEMRGQRAVLHGIVENDADISAAHRVALSAAGPGGAWPGGVTSVDATGLSVGAFERPYVWRIRRDGARVTLSGAAPSEHAKADLMSLAGQEFENAETIDEMRVAGGAPSPLFASIARDAVRILAALNAGEVRIVDRQIAVIGDGDQDAVNAAERLLGAPPAPFRARLDLTVDGLDPNHPELQGLNLVNGDAQTCERAFQRLMERNVINFEQGSAAIAPSSREILDALASVALRCDRFGIEVSGHTDNTGSRELNMDLSHQRADAVVNYLVGQGVSRSRLEASGYGPDRPRASNATDAGRAANRRIEFDVSG